MICTCVEVLRLYYDSSKQNDHKRVHPVPLAFNYNDDVNIDLGTAHAMLLTNILNVNSSYGQP